MKRFFTSLAALATIALGADAQSEYMMKVAASGGQTISIDAADVEQVTFQAPDAVDKLKQHVRTQMKSIAENVDLTAFKVVGQSLQQFNDNVLLSGNYREQMQLVLLQLLPAIVQQIQPQDAPEALAAQGITKVMPIDLAVLDGTLAFNDIDKTVGFVPGTDGLSISYTKEQSGQQITNTLKCKGSGSKYQLVIPLTGKINISGLPVDEGTALILSLPQKFDFSFATNAFGVADYRPLAASFNLDIQSESPYIAGLGNPFTITGEVDTNIPTQTGQPDAKKLSFSTNIDPTKNATKSSFKFLIGELPVADFNFSGNLNPEQKIDLSKFDLATFDLLTFVTNMLTNSTMSADLMLMGDLGVSINILDGLAATQLTLASNQARHENDQAKLAAIAEQLNQAVTGKFTCKGVGIIDAPIKFQTVPFGVDLVNMPAIDLEGNGTYTPLTKLYDMQSIIYGVNIGRHALEPMGDAVTIVGQLVKFVQGIVGALSSDNTTE